MNADYLYLYIKKETSEYCLIFKFCISTPLTPMSCRVKCSAIEATYTPRTTYLMMSNNLIVLLSGKRKTGKDYISEKLLKAIGEDKCAIVRISEPIKSQYAKEHNLDLSELMSPNKYKEEYRKQMIIWSDQVRSQDPSYFCKIACSEAVPKPIWIVSDIRRKTDIKWFKATYGGQIRTVRISATEQTRVNRGFVFTKGCIHAVGFLRMHQGNHLITSPE
ncbi:phosphomevalonate kinase isoform X2 [Photinus pyralis]|uniref:phosphomevalonate kinase isoform X2 n=1 Tax=Photinus pyralis TaxID=7054 RepID=UPI0012674D04|nr:phosphomevalonate kinase isoform X2 [Photinus pyralis]